MHTEDWQTHISRIEQLARAQGLKYHPVEFEVVPESFMTEIAIYGLPVRMPHWSFGVRYIYRLVQHRLGMSRLFEVVFPGNPGRAYLARNNSNAENVLVAAHVLGHADFSANNLLFRASAAQVGDHIVEQAAAHARQIGAAIEEHGAARVEAVLDAALALEQHVDIDARLLREAEFLPPEDYVDAIKCHSDVVRPTASGDRVSLDINPYHLGFWLWEKIIEQHGIEHARRVMQQDDDFAFVRGHLTAELASELQMFRYKGAVKGPFQVQPEDIGALHEALLAPKFGFGAPSVAAAHVRVDGTLELAHDHTTDGRGLDAERASRVLDYLVKVWRRPIVLNTVNGEGAGFEVAARPV